MHPNIDLEKLASEMFQAVMGALAKDGKLLGTYAKDELKSYAEQLAEIAELLATQDITESEAKEAIDEAKKSMRATILAIEGIGDVAVQRAVDAALAVLKTAAKPVLGLIV